MSNCCSADRSEKLEGVCPECGNKERKVGRITMEHLVQPSLVSEIAVGQYFFCQSPACKAVYFSPPGERIFHKQDLTVRVGLKETEDPVPICYCFGYSRKMAWDEIAETGKTEIPNKIKAEIQAGNCACEIKNPSGRCCLGNVGQAVREGVQNLEQQLAVGGVKRSYSLNPQKNLACEAKDAEKNGGTEMKGNVEEIAGKLRQAGLPPKLSSDEIRLFIQTWRRLAEGRAISPHEVEQMAMSLQIAPAVATSTVSKLSERDGEGNFVGFSGLSLKTHPHRLRVNGHRLSTWCAWDCLFIPLFLKQTVEVQSICPATKTNITLMITPERVANHDPTRTVISMITPRTTKRGLDSAEEIRMDFCRYVHFLSSPEAASQWIASKKLDISTLSVEEGYQLGRLVFAEFLKYA